MTHTCHISCAFLRMQLYRVNVLLQPPDATDQAALSRPPFFVLRRYSQFRQLFMDVSSCCTTFAAIVCSCSSPVCMLPILETTHMGDALVLRGSAGWSMSLSGVLTHGTAQRSCMAV